MSLPLLLLLAVFHLSASSPAIQPDGTFDVHGNYIPNESSKSRPRSNCCLVPVCEYDGNCYDSIECGYKCSQGNYQRAEYGPTPGYVRRDSFTEYQCLFDKCRTYEFLCTHCPRPDEVKDFSVYTVRKDCRKCYYTASN